MVRRRGFGSGGICAGSLLIFLFFSLAGNGLAQHGHGGGTTSPDPKGVTKGGVPQKGSAHSVTLEGLKISLEVMSMDQHMKHLSQGSSHGGAVHASSNSLMVTLQDVASKEIISDARVNYILIGPSGGKETGKLEWSGDHYGGGFTPKEKGTYRVQLKIENSGMEREAQFEYQAR